MSEVEKKIGLESLEKARLYKSNRNYGRAFAHYLVYFELFPNNKAEEEMEFTRVLCNWGIFLEQRNRVEDLCKCYIQAMTYFPESSIILNNFGAHLIRLGEPEAAKRYLELACNCDPEFLPAEKNLQYAKLCLVPRWHFKMLNDFTRNFVYFKAIEKILDEKYNRVIDIGTGSGILSLAASQMAHVKSIVAIEQSKTLYKIAKKIFSDNKAEITLINKYSTDLMLGEARGNFLVTEIFDAAFFGEHILGTLIHAWKYLLDNDSKVVPESAEVSITGINCRDLYKNCKLLENIPELNLIDACVFHSTSHSYEAENLKDRLIDYLTNTCLMARVDFYDFEQLTGFLQRQQDYFQPVVLECKQDGTLNAFAVWFDLYLTKDIFITTNPLRKNVSCWEQAVFYLDHPMAVKKGDKLQLQISLPEERLEVTLINQEVPRCAKCFRVTPQIITYLNDVNLVRQIIKLTEFFESKHDLVILDLNTFPLFGLLMAKEGAKVYCSAKCVGDIDFLKYISDINKLVDFHVIPEDQLECLEQLEQLDVLFMTPINHDGTVLEDILIDGSVYGKKVKPEGMILPLNIYVVFQIVDAHYLHTYNTVDDAYLPGFQISKYFKEYEVNESCLVNPKIPHAKLSQAIKTNPLVIGEVPVESTFEVLIEEFGSANAILYWYEIEYLGNVKYETYESTHYSCAAFLMQSPKLLNKGDTIQVKFKQHKGFISLYIPD